MTAPATTIRSDWTLPVAVRAAFTLRSEWSVAVTATGQPSFATRSEWSKVIAAQAIAILDPSARSDWSSAVTAQAIILSSPRSGWSLPVTAQARGSVLISAWSAPVMSQTQSEPVGTVRSTWSHPVTITLPTPVIPEGWVFRALRPIFVGDGSGFVRSFNIGDLIPAGIVEVLFLDTEEYQKARSTTY